MSQKDDVRSLDDASRRMSDAIRLAILAGDSGKWMAFRLSDGGSDQVVYDTKPDAVRHQFHEFLCAYVKIPKDDMGPAAAASYLALNRKLYDAGMRIKDPEKHVIMPRTVSPELLDLAINSWRN